MSIQVVSNAPLAGNSPAGSDAAETPSKPVAEKAAEQTHASEKDAEEVEAEEETQSEDEPEADEAEGDSQEELKDKTRKKAKSGAQRRKERAERAEAEVARLQKIVEEMARKNASHSDESEPAQSKEKNPSNDPKAKPVKPRMSEFETAAEYEEAEEAYLDRLADWKFEQREKAAREREERDKLIKEHETAQKTYAERVAAFAKEVEDYHEVIEGIDDIIFPPAALDAITSSELGAQIAYELAKNREEAERIAKLPPGRIYREIGKLEARLEAKASAPKTEAQPKKTTNAPHPITPVGGKASGAPKRLEDAKTQAEFEAMVREREKRRASSW
jgi:hypothetical protein